MSPTLTTTMTRDDSRAVKQAQLDKVAQVTHPAFLEQRVRRHLPPAAPGATWRTRTIQLDGSGAATVRISLDDGPAVYAKLFPFADGPQVYAKLLALREAGLGSGSADQAVEPLDWYDDVRLLICRAAPGTALSERIGGDPDELAAGCARAGRWLARLHGSGLQVGEAKSLLVTGELLSLAKRLAKVVAQQPAHLAPALEMVAVLEDLAADTKDGLLAQSHGQYRPIHVFLDAETTTVIDLDRSGPADPSRDVAEFLHRLRLSTFSVTGAVDAADRPCSSFLAGYREGTEPDNLHNLRFHWGRYIAHSLNRKIKTGDATPDGGDPVLAFYRAEFARVVSGQALQ